MKKKLFVLCLAMVFILPSVVLGAGGAKDAVVFAATLKELGILK